MVGFEYVLGKILTYRLKKKKMNFMRSDLDPGDIPSRRKKNNARVKFAKFVLHKSYKLSNN